MDPHALAAVGGLTRLELVTEAMCAALEELAAPLRKSSPGLVTEEWGRRRAQSDGASGRRHR
jgi:hypothetical protein